MTKIFVFQSARIVVASPRQQGQQRPRISTHVRDVEQRHIALCVI